MTRRAFPWTLAAPSFVTPGTAAENCRFLSGRVDEVALLLFETKACLAYGPDDLPEDLSILGLTCHAHLPLDLDWSTGAGPAFEAAAGLARLTAHLSPRWFVLHPPSRTDHLADFLRRWAAAGLDPSRVLLENTEENDLAGCLEVIYHGSPSVCLDLGHALAYGHGRLLRDQAVLDRTRMLHLYAPGPQGRHLSLEHLDAAGRSVLRRVLAALAPDATVVLELFDWSSLERSLSLFEELIQAWGLGVKGGTDA